MRKTSPNPLSALRIVRRPRSNTPAYTLWGWQDSSEISGRLGVKYTVGRFGETSQGVPALLLNALLPFEEPGARAGDSLENLGHRFLLIKEPEHPTAITTFIRLFLVHTTDKQVVMNDRKWGYRSWSKSVREVMRLLPN